MGFKHFSHEHRLIFGEEKHTESNGVEVSCYGCKQPISGASYRCRRCKHFYLHKVCAELPEEMQHPMHPEHPLILLPTPPNSQWRCVCGACRRPCENFTYGCSLCKFYIDILCALVVHKIKDNCHDHPLTPLQRPSLFLCDSCHTRHEGTFYHCTTCKFWINQKCASSRSNVEYSPHTLPSALPRIEYFRSDLIRLPMSHDSLESDVTKKTSMQYWKSKKSTKIYNVSHRHPLVLVDKQITDDESCPMSELLACKGCAKPILGPFYHCTKCAFILHECCAEFPIELQHPIHPEHPLILNKWESVYSDLPLCQGCKMSCNGFFYGCVACDFFLDLNCSSFVMHDAHPHILTLGETIGGFCPACQEVLHGVGFVCDVCTFTLHVRCVSLPGPIRHRYDEHPFSLIYFGSDDIDEDFCEICEEVINTNCWFYHCGEYYQSLHTECIRPAATVSSPHECFITHEAHKHTLALKETSKVPCAACKHNVYGIGFVCDDCNFALHTRCASLPDTVTLRYDDSPYVLTYSGDQDPGNCAFCSRQINQECRFYHCDDYSQSLHTICIQVAEYSNIKTGDKLNVGGHTHLLTYFTHPKDLSPCNSCGLLVEGQGFECEPCNFRLHKLCASSGVSNTILELQSNGKLDP